MCTSGSPTTLIVVRLSIRAGASEDLPSDTISIDWCTARRLDTAVMRLLEGSRSKRGHGQKRLALIKGINPWWQDLAEGWAAKTELQISRYAWDDNQFEHNGGAREVAALRFSETSYEIQE